MGECQDWVMSHVRLDSKYPLEGARSRAGNMLGRGTVGTPLLYCTIAGKHKNQDEGPAILGKAAALVSICEGEIWKQVRLS